MTRRRTPYIADPNVYRQHYSGSGLDVFKGDYLYQNGSGLLGTLFRKAIPLLKKAVVPALKNTGKVLLKSGVKVISDVASGKKPIKEALVSRGKEALQEVGQDVTQQIMSTMKRKLSPNDNEGTSQKTAKRNLGKHAVTKRKRKKNKTKLTGGNLFY